MEYLIILILILIGTLILEKKEHVQIYRTRKERWTIPFILFIFGSIWDTYAVWRGHWSFAGPGLIGIRIGLLPLEEYLFMLVVPYAIITYYKFLEKKI